MTRRRRSKEVTPDVALPVAGTDALPGSAEKIEVLAGRYAAGKMLFAGGDVIEDESRRNHFVRSKNGTDVNTGIAVSLAGEGGKKRRAIKTVKSEANSIQSGGILVGSRLRAFFARLMRTRKLTYGQLEEMTGVPKGHVYNIVTGRHVNPRISTLYMMAVGLGVSLDEMLDYRPGRAV